jgi:hypothetical protein
MLVPAEGIEPPTFGLQNRCSTAELSRLPEARRGALAASLPAKGVAINEGFCNERFCDGWMANGAMASGLAAAVWMVRMILAADRHQPLGGQRAPVGSGLIFEGEIEEAFFGEGISAFRDEPASRRHSHQIFLLHSKIF